MTQAATDELAPTDVDRAARRSQRHVDEPRPTTSPTPATRWRPRSPRPPRAGSTTSPTRCPTRWCWSATRPGPACRRTRARARAARATPAGSRRAARCRRSSRPPSGWRPGCDSDVLWLSERTDRVPARLHVAPLQVWGPMRDKLLADKTVVFTSATLRLGGDFGAVATSLGLKPSEEGAEPDADVRPAGRCRGAGSTSARRSTTASRRSSTSPATCRRPVATGSARPSSTRSSSWSTPPRAGPSGCSRAAGPPRRPPRSYASGCPT